MVALPVRSEATALVRPSMAASASDVVAAAAFGLACAVGLAGAFIGLDVHGFWFDELFTAWILEPDSGSSLVARIATDTHPPVYYLAAYLYSRIVGDGEVALRSFSALLACAAIVVFAVGTRRTFSVPGRMFGAAMASGSLFWFFHAQNARSYALCMLVSAGILALCLSLLAEGPPRRERLRLGMLVALMFAGSFVHFYVMYESLAALIVLALLRRQHRIAIAIAGTALFAAATLYVKLIVGPSSQFVLGTNWIPNDVTWYLRVLESCLQYTFGTTGGIAMAVCAGLAAFRCFGPTSDSQRRRQLDPELVLLLGVPLLVLAGGIASSMLVAPNFFDRNFLVLSPFFWAISARLYDAAMAGASPTLRTGGNIALAALLFSMASIVVQRLPPRDPPLLYEPFRESAEWIRSLPECRDQIVPVIATDRRAWYKPGYAETVFGSAYGRYLDGFARPVLVFLEDIVGHNLPAEMRAEVQRRLDGRGCPVIAWSVHNMTADFLALATRELLASVERPAARAAVEAKAFKNGQIGYVLHVSGKAGR